MSRLILVRHGQTAHNKDRRIQGHIDEPLDDIGRQQAQKLAAHLKAGGLSQPRFHSSDLSRALTTAQAIQAQVGGTLETYADLREIDLGSWEGELFDDIASREPALHRQFWSGDPLCRPPNGETAAEVQGRMAQHLQNHWPRAGETLVIVSHGLAITALLCHLLGLDYQQEWASKRIMHHNTAYSVLLADAYTREILAVQLALKPHLDA